MVEPGPITSRVVLLGGFGGLLVLMGYAGVDGIHALEQIRTSNDTVREDFLARTRLLERIRGDVYVSGTYVRDYLLEPESGKAEGHRYSLLETRNDTDAALASYRKLVNARGVHQLYHSRISGWSLLVLVLAAAVTVFVAVVFSPASPILARYFEATWHSFTYWLTGKL